MVMHRPCSGCLAIRSDGVEHANGQNAKEWRLKGKPWRTTPIPTLIPTVTASSTPTAVVTPAPTACERIIFVSDRDGNSEIYVMNADGTGQANLINEPTHDYDAAWLPSTLPLLRPTSTSEPSSPTPPAVTPTPEPTRQQVHQPQWTIFQLSSGGQVQIVLEDGLNTYPVASVDPEVAQFEQ
jgi:hypothetical protein